MWAHLQGISKIGIDIKGIAFVGLFGQPCAMDKIEEISKNITLILHNLGVI